MIKRIRDDLADSRRHRVRPAPAGYRWWRRALWRAWQEAKFWFVREVEPWNKPVRLPWDPPEETMKDLLIGIVLFWVVAFALGFSLRLVF